MYLNMLKRCQTKWFISEKPINEMSDECNKKRQSLGLINLSLQNQPTESTLLATVSNVSANLSSLSSMFYNL